MNMQYPQENYQIISSNLLLVGLLSQLFGLIISLLEQALTLIKKLRVKLIVLKTNQELIEEKSISGF